jgi:adenylate cyclase
MERRLAAILAMDVVGYSGLMERDEVGTLRTLKALRQDIIDSKVAGHGGRVVKLMGDGALVEFASAVNAVRCAIAIQMALEDRSKDVPQDTRVQLRIGINIGDVIVEGDDLYGEGINLAARLESIATPGGICISAKVNDEIAGKIEQRFADAGDQQVKNIARPVRVWRWTPQAAAPAADQSPLPDKPSISVLPFTNMSGDPEQEYFADGITEDIITDLSKVSGLFVIARNSSFAYKGKSPDVRQVCRELGVRHVLEGSVRKAGRRVRITAQLIDGASGGHLWAERYDRDLEDIFAVQDEVTAQIVAALKVALTSGERSRRESRGKVDPEAYDCLVHGRACLYRFTPEALIESRALLERAVALDPGLAPAYAWLSALHSAEHANGWNKGNADHLAVAQALAEQALKVDPNEPYGYHALALARMWQRDLAGAERAAEQTLALDPNFAGAYTALGSVRDYAGRHQSAIDTLQQALRLDPQYNVALQFLGRAQFMLERYDEAEATFKRRLIGAPRSDMTRAFLASLYGHTGRHEAARDMWREVLEINPAFSVAHLHDVMPYADPDRFERFCSGLRKAGLL